MTETGGIGTGPCGTGTLEHPRTSTNMSNE